MLASTYQMTGDIAQAQALLDSVTPAEADDWYFPIMASNAILSRNYERAIAMVKEQLGKPQVLRAALGLFQNTLADLERHAGHTDAASQTYQQARATLEAAVREQAGSADLISSLGWAETWLGNKSKALDLARKQLPWSRLPEMAIAVRSTKNSWRALRRILATRKARSPRCSAC